MADQKTPSLKASEVARKWYVIDASDNTLGRVATVAAEKLIGKHKATFSPNIDNGDYVVIVNTDKLKVTGKKLNQKIYYRHSGYMGGLTETTLEDLKGRDSTLVFSNAIKGMLPKNKLQSGRLARLKLYAGADHEHNAQKPEKIGAK